MAIEDLELKLQQELSRRVVRLLPGNVDGYDGDPNLATGAALAIFNGSPATTEYTSTTPAQTWKKQPDGAWAAGSDLGAVNQDLIPDVTELRKIGRVAEAATVAIMEWEGPQDDGSGFGWTGGTLWVDGVSYVVGVVSGNFLYDFVAAFQLVLNGLGLATTTIEMLNHPIDPYPASIARMSSGQRGAAKTLKLTGGAFTGPFTSTPTLGVDYAGTDAVAPKEWLAGGSLIPLNDSITIGREAVAEYIPAFRIAYPTTDFVEDWSYPWPSGSYYSPLDFSLSLVLDDTPVTISYNPVPVTTAVDVAAGVNAQLASAGLGATWAATPFAIVPASQPTLTYYGITIAPIAPSPGRIWIGSTNYQYVEPLALWDPHGDALLELGTQILALYSPVVFEGVAAHSGNRFGSISAASGSLDRARIVGQAVDSYYAIGNAIEFADELAYGGATIGGYATALDGVARFTRGDGTALLPPLSVGFLLAESYNPGFPATALHTNDRGGAINMGSAYAPGDNVFAEVRTSGYGSFLQGYAAAFGGDCAAELVSGGTGSFLQGYALAQPLGDASMFVGGAGSFLQGFVSASSAFSGRMEATAEGCFVHGRVYQDGSGAALIHCSSAGGFVGGLVSGFGEIRADSFPGAFAHGTASGGYKIRVEGDGSVAIGAAFAGDIEAIGINAFQFGIGTNNSSFSWSLGETFRWHYQPLLVAPGTVRDGDFWMVGSTIWVHQEGVSQPLVGAADLSALNQDILPVSDQSNSIGKQFDPGEGATIQGSGVTFPLVASSYQIHWKVNGFSYVSDNYFNTGRSGWTLLQWIAALSADATFWNHWTVTDVGGQAKLTYNWSPLDIVEIPTYGPGPNNFNTLAWHGIPTGTFSGGLLGTPTPAFDTPFAGVSTPRLRWKELNAHHIHCGIMEIGVGSQSTFRVTNGILPKRKYDYEIGPLGARHPLLDGPQSPRILLEQTATGEANGPSYLSPAHRVPGTPNGIASDIESVRHILQWSPNVSLSMVSDFPAYFLNVFADGELYPYVVGTNVTGYPVATGRRWMFFDQAGFYQEGDGTPPTEDQIRRGVRVASIYWNTDQDVETSVPVVFWEYQIHPAVMDGTTREYLDAVHGATWTEGFAPTALAPGGSGAADADAEILVSNGQIRIADIILDWQDGVPNAESVSQVIGIPKFQNLSPIAQIPVLYRYGATADWWRVSPGNFPFFHGGSAAYNYAGTRVPINEDIGGGNWDLTEVADGSYIVISVFGTAEVRGGVVAIQGRVEHLTLDSAERAAAKETLAILRDDLPGDYFVPLFAIIVQSATAYANTPKARIVTLHDGEEFVDFRGISLDGKATAAALAHALWAQYDASPVWTPTNVTTDRAFDANSTSLDEVADVLGTLINELKTKGVLS